jgi:type I restriction enzyme S subunit
MSALEETLPDGYKKTEIGIFPTSWQTSSLSDLLTKIIDNRGKTPPITRDGEFELIETASISFVGLYPDYTKVIKRVSSATYTNWFRGHPQKDDLLISTVGEYSGASAILGLDRGTIAQNLIALRLKNENNSKFVFYWTRSSLYRMQLDQVMMNQAQPSLRVPWLLNFKLPIPKRPEQTAIATALSDMDALLSELEKLIAKKQAIKTATMQQLLTGKTRLPQFAFYSDINSTEGAVEGKRNNTTATNVIGGMDSRRKGTKTSELGEIPEDWEVVRFGNIVNYIKGYPFKSGEYTDSGIRVVRVSDTSFTTIKNENPIFVSLKSKNKYKKWSLEEGNIIFTTVGSKPPMYDSLVGKAILVESQHSGYLLNQNAVLIKPKLKAKNISNLLISHFRTERYIDHIEQIYRGNANQASITLDGLFQFEIPLPTEPEEQTAIATILSDMDNEIQTLEQRLSKTRQIKQGMMQELLTGKTRLPFEQGKEA